MSDREEMQRQREFGLKQRHETRQERAILRSEWRAQEDDTLGGWCITDAAIPGTPADGNPPIAHFIHEKVALHIAGIHNDWLRDINPEASA